jgi:peptidoglycan DL-endopeptidase CwlO
VDATGIANLLADRMIAHRSKLQVDQQTTQQLQDALTQGANELTTSRDAQGKDAKTLLEHWKSDAADKFENSSHQLGTELHVVSAAGTSAASIVEGLAQSVTTAHGATQSLIDEYTSRVGSLLGSAQAVAGAGGSSALLGSFAQVIDLANSYSKETAQVLSAADGTAGNAATQLKALTAQLTAEKIAAPKVPATGSSAVGGKTGGGAKGDSKAHGDTKAHGGGKSDGGTTAPGKHHTGGKHQPAGNGGGKSTKPSDSKKASTIIAAAKRNLGYHERGDNIDKFGPPGAPWCSYFATAMWRKAGVNIPNYGFTGDVYTWGQAHHLAYDANHLDQVRPGDVLLFGTGPQNATTSTHIAIVEAVHGNTVTTIEGNEGDAVRTETHTLSSSTFYGGVHP